MVKLQATVAALLLRVLAEVELELFLQDIESKQFPMPADAPEDVLESLVEEDADLSAEVMDVLN